MPDRDHTPHHNPAPPPDSDRSDQPQASFTVHEDLLPSVDTPNRLLDTEALPDRAPTQGRDSAHATTGSHLSRAQAARLRRIVRDGAEVSHRLARMKEDLRQELLDTPVRKEWGEARIQDLISDIDRAFDVATFFANGQANAARQRLENNAEPLAFHRTDRSQVSDPPEIEEASPRLWDLFVTGAMVDLEAE